MNAPNPPTLPRPVRISDYDGLQHVADACRDAGMRPELVTQLRACLPDDGIPLGIAWLEAPRPTRARR